MFKEGDVVAFADGNGKMHLFGDAVDVKVMFVQSVEDDEVTVTSYPYEFKFASEKLVKIGHKSDTHYNDEGDEVEIWYPEVHEDS